MALTGAKGLLRWCQQVTEEYDNVHVTNMTTSWRDGLAFCAILHHFNPNTIDYYSLSKENIAQNNSIAFTTAEREFGIPALLDVEDMVSMPVPDKLSIMTYVSQYYATFRDQVAAKPAPTKQSPPKRPPEWKNDERQTKKKAGEKVSVVPGVTAAKEVIGSPPKTSFASGLHQCASCGKPVYLMERLNAENKVFHRICFKCSVCNAQLRPTQYRYIPLEKKFYCDTHYRARTVSISSDDGSGQQSGLIPSRLRNLSFGRKSKLEDPPAQEGYIGARNSAGHTSDEKRSFPAKQQSHYETPYLYSGIGQQQDFDIFAAHTSEDVAGKVHDREINGPSPENTSRDARSFISSALSKNMDLQHGTGKTDLSRIRSADPVMPSQSRKGPAREGDVSPQEVDNPVYGHQIDLQPGPKRNSLPPVCGNEYAEPNVDTSAVGAISSNPFITSDKKLHGSSAGPSRGSTGGAENGRTQGTSSGDVKKLVLKVKKKKGETGSDSSGKPLDNRGAVNTGNFTAFSKTQGKDVSLEPSRVTGVEISNKIDVHYPPEDTVSARPLDGMFMQREQLHNHNERVIGHEGFDESKSWAPTFNRTESNDSAISEVFSSHVSDEDSQRTDSQHLKVGEGKKKKFVLRVKKGSLREQSTPSPSHQSYLTSDASVGGMNGLSYRESENTRVLPGNSAKNDIHRVSQPLKTAGEKAIDPVPSVSKKSPNRPPPPRSESVEHLSRENGQGGGVVPFSENQSEYVTPAKLTPLPNKGQSKSADDLARNVTTVSSYGGLENQQTRQPPPRPHLPYEANASKSVGNLANGSSSDGKILGNNANTRRTAPDVPPVTSSSNLNRPPRAVKEPSPVPRQQLSASGPSKPDRGKPRNVSSSRGRYPWNRRSKAPSLDLEEKKLTKEEMQEELREIEVRQRELELRGVEMEKMLREKLQGEPEEEYMIDWFNLVTEKNRLLRRENELIYVCQEQDYFANQKAIEAELRRLMEKDERKKTKQDRKREDELLETLLSFVSKRSSIIEKLEEDRVREREEDAQIEMVMEAQGLTREKREKRGPKSMFYC